MVLRPIASLLWFDGVGKACAEYFCLKFIKRGLYFCLIEQEESLHDIAVLIACYKLFAYESHYLKLINKCCSCCMLPSLLRCSQVEFMTW